DEREIPVVEFEEVEAVRSGKQKGVVIDVREPEELARDGRVPGFHNIPLKFVKEGAFGLEPEEFQMKYNFAKPKAEDLIIFSCRSGRRSLIAAQEVAKLKYTK
ncbi:unnamed protein product, partial [Ixodes hexagonus]